MTMSGLAANRRPRVVPDLTQKLQTGIMAIECLIWLSGTQGAQYMTQYMAQYMAQDTAPDMAQDMTQYMAKDTAQDTAQQ